MVHSRPNRYIMSEKPYHFRTSAGDDAPIPLNEAEVVVWKTKDFDEIRIEWIDRCAKSYRLQICRQPENVDCRSFDVDAPDTSDAYPSRVITDLASCSAYSFEISAKKDGEDRLLYSGFHRTQVDVSSDFKLSPLHFEALQNASSITVRWQHVSACVAGYTLLAEFETSQKSEIVAPDLTLPNSDPIVNFEFSSQNLLKQCRNYSVSITPILNTTEVDVDDVEIVAFEASIFYFNEPTSPDDVSVVDKTSNLIELEWAHLPWCYEGYHVTLTRVGDEKTIFAGETR